MGLEMNTNIVEGIFYSLPAPSYATWYYYMMIFPCSPPTNAVVPPVPSVR